MYFRGLHPTEKKEINMRKKEKAKQVFQACISK